MPCEQVRRDAVSFSGTITACERRSRWPDALEVISFQESHPSFGVFSCTSTITGCAKEESWHRGLALFGLMPAARVVPNVAVANSAMRAFERGAQWQPAVEMLGRTSLRDVISFGTGVSACERLGQWLQALAALTGMVWLRFLPDLITCNAAISAVRLSSDGWMTAASLLRSAREANLRLDAVSYSALGLDAHGGWRWTLQLLPHMRLELIEVDVVSHGVVMSSLEKASRWQGALRLLDVLANSTATDVRSYSSAISACARSSQRAEAFAILDSMEDHSFRPNLVCYCSVITACERSGEWELALAVLSAMPAARVVPDTISYSSVISAMEKAAQWQLALALLLTMGASSATPNAISFNAGISACEQRGRWQVAASLLDLLLQSGLQPDTVSYNSALSSCEKAQKWRPAAHLLQELAGRELQPNAITFGALLGASKQAWQKAGWLLASMPGHRVAANSVCLDEAAAAYEGSANSQPMAVLLAALSERDVADALRGV
ncbi:unnamed protein product [Symbiodinium natans]|uniref:Pentatricopeptide repeat-containing protein, chloroplastic n=1 Tax=Symbiodinium natans TaxID=878477 RepID=A0A812PVT4_9DINO|nr:unnamed protein product [Symbiodinium natans]